jgi:NAD(P)H-dependent flavin oxidoreductase YrpB (nitropropane dioxygenase family)
MVSTSFTELTGCRLPLQLAVLGGVGTAELAAEVTRAGGLGMVPWGVVPPDAALGPCGAGILVPFAPAPVAIAAGARGLRVLEFFFGDPDAVLVEAGHAAGALVSWQVGSLAEALAAERAGCDLVVAQGLEAGGHVRGTVTLDALLPQLVAAVHVPVVAAGGAGSAERVAELLMAGAAAVRAGTRFVATRESDAHPDYVRALIEARPEDTVLTDHFDQDGGWPATVRVLAASLAAAREAGNRSTAPPTRRSKRHALVKPCYAGLSVEHVQAVQPARDVVHELTALAR